MTSVSTQGLQKCIDPFKEAKISQARIKINQSCTAYFFIKRSFKFYEVRDLRATGVKEAIALYNSVSKLFMLQFISHACITLTIEN